MNPYRAKDDVEQIAISQMNINEYTDQLRALEEELEEVQHKIININAMIEEEFDNIERLSYGR